jgi:2-C-methyl-D-erythritol 4-phosphate cytidylyltransferase/2-C-methyl-D-erythritol 2,4-cyclodiphosphate synthase
MVRQPLVVSVIIAAGGRGRRFGGAVPKQLLAVHGKSPLERALDTFASHDEVSEIIVALPEEFVADPPLYVSGMSKPVRLVPGGARRQDSVANAFQLVDRGADVVVVHDAARPFVSEALISRTIAAAAETGAAVAALRSSDTVKRGGLPGGSPAGGHLLVAETLPRDAIYLAQTPQAFRRDVLQDALALSEVAADATDEASLAERAGHRVRLVEGESTNIKITTPADAPVADAIARKGVADRRPSRVGTGYDLHRLVMGRPLALGGVIVPSDRGATGHSDADVACHAAIDALLGAAGLGDIGRLFPDTDPQWKNASGADLLTRTAAVVATSGYEIVNLDLTIVLERPKIRDHVAAMRSAVARALGIDPARVSIKGKTNEGLDSIGRGEAIAAHAVALLTFVGGS